MASSLYKLPTYDKEKVNPLGVFFKELRKQVFYSPEKAAGTIGVYRTTVVRWEQGENVPENVRGYFAFLTKRNVDRYGDLAQDLLDRVNLAIVEDEKLCEMKVEKFKDWSEVYEEADAFISAGVKRRKADVPQQADQALFADLLPNSARQDSISTSQVPLDRPRPVPYFTLRYDDEEENEIEKIIADLHPGEIVTLFGPPGIGKTSLAIEVIRALSPDGRLPDRFPDGIIFHSFYNQPSTDAALEQIAHKLGEGEYATKPTPRDAAQRAMAQKQAFIILDSVEAAGDLHKILDVGGQCGFLLTTWDKNDVEGKVHSVGLMPPDKSRIILEAWSRGQVADQEIADQICELVGYLPLALRIAGSYMFQGMLTAPEYLDLLKQTPLEALTLSERQHESVRILIEKSLEEVSESARTVLAVVGVLALEPFADEVVAAALDISKIEMKRLLRELTNYSFLERTEQGYQVVHRLIHTYAQSMSAPGAAVERLADYYTRFVREQTDLDLEDFEQLDAERPHILAVVAACAEQKDWHRVRLLSSAICDYLDSQGYWADLITTCTIGLGAAKVLQDRLAETIYLGRLANAYRSKWEDDKAVEYYEKALQIYEQEDFPFALFGLAETYTSLGSVYHAREEYDKAVEYYEKAQHMYEQEGDRLLLVYCDINSYTDDDRQVAEACTSLRVGAQASVYLMLCLLYTERGELDKAAIYDEQAKHIIKITAEEIGITNLALPGIHMLGMIYTARGELDKAIEFYELFLQRNRPRRRESLAVTYQSLGWLYSKREELNKAAESFEQALQILKQTDNIHSIACICGWLGKIYETRGEFGKAIEIIERARQIYAQLGDTKTLATLYSILSGLYFNKRDLDKVLECWHQELRIYEKLEDIDRIRIAALYNRLGVVYVRKREMDRASQFFQQAQHIYEQLGDHHGKARSYYLLGAVYLLRREWRKAVEVSLHGLEIDPNDALVYYILAKSYLALDKLDEAISYYQKQLESHPETALFDHVGLGVIARYQGKDDTAQQHFEMALNVWKKKQESGSYPKTSELEFKAIALLGVGYTEQAMTALTEALAQYEYDDVIDFTLYDLLAKAPNPPQGLDKMRRLLEKTKEKIQKDQNGFVK